MTKPLNVCAFDTETHLFTAGNKAPRVVCYSFAIRSEKYGTWQGVKTPAQGHTMLANAIDSGFHIVCHHAAFDIAVDLANFPTLENVQRWFRALDEGRVSCTMLREKLLDIARGFTEFKPDFHSGKMRKVNRKVYSLATLVWDRFGEVLEGKEGADTWRMRYSELDGVPVEQYPRAAYDYALLDAVKALQVWDSQNQQVFTAAGPVNLNAYQLLDEVAQTQAALAYMLCTVWGLRSDAERVRMLEAYLQAELDKANAELAGVAVMLPPGTSKHRVLPDGRNPLLKADGGLDTKVLAHIVSEAYGGNPPLTDKGAVKTSEDVLSATEHPALRVLAKVSGVKFRLSTYLPPLKRGTFEPICPEFDTLKDSGRVSGENPNIQNQPRKGAVRPCYTARPGFLFLNGDYNQVELCSLANFCVERYGFSRMADLLREGKDLHVAFGLQLLNAEHGLSLSYQDFVDCLKGKHGPEWQARAKYFRQLAKVGNFGFPGGLGAEKLCEYATGYGLHLQVDQTKQLKAKWLETFPELKLYFQDIGAACAGDSGGTIQQLYSGRIRANVQFCAACNQNFQGGTADGAKRALYLISRACYSDPSSPLFGARPVFAVHDEFMLEVPEWKRADGVTDWKRITAAAREFQRLMIEGMKAFHPHVPIVTEPVLMRHWYKDAEPVFTPEGFLTVWEPSEPFNPAKLEEAA
jgi:DNA polymerase-1